MALVARDPEGADVGEGEELAGKLGEEATAPLLIEHARIFDSETATMKNGMSVLVVDGRIRAVGPDGTIPIPRDAEVVDAAGKSVLPGLWDMHVHLDFESGALMNLAAGVTSVRDLGNDTDRLLEARRGYDEGTTIGPRVILAGFVDGPGPYAGPTKVLVDSPGRRPRRSTATSRWATSRSRFTAPSSRSWSR